MAIEEQRKQYLKSLGSSERKLADRDDVKKALEDPTIFEKLRSGRMTVTELAKPPAKNFREIEIDIGNASIKIGGMAHPILYRPEGRSLHGMMVELKLRDFNSMISLDGRYRDPVKKAFTRIDPNKMEYFNSDVVDFAPLSISQYREIYGIVKGQAEKNHNIIIHCGEGYGRTGTVISGIKLMADLEKKYADNPSFIDTYSLIANKIIFLGKHAANPQTTCTEAVLKAITSVRNSIQTGGMDLNTEGSSVENEAQVASLVKLEERTILLIKNIKDLRCKIEQFVEKGLKLSDSQKDLLTSSSFPTVADYKSLLNIIDQMNMARQAQLQAFVEKGYRLSPQEEHLKNMPTTGDSSKGPYVIDRHHSDLIALNEGLTSTIKKYQNIDSLLSHLENLKKRYDHPDEISKLKLKKITDFITAHKENPENTISELKNLQTDLAVKRKLDITQMYKGGFMKTGLANIKKKIANDENMTPNAKQEVISILNNKKGPAR